MYASQKKHHTADHTENFHHIRMHYKLKQLHLSRRPSRWSSVFPLYVASLKWDEINMWTEVTSIPQSSQQASAFQWHQGPHKYISYNVCKKTNSNSTWQLRTWHSSWTWVRDLTAELFAFVMGRSQERQLKPRQENWCVAVAQPPLLASGVPHVEVNNQLLNANWAQPEQDCNLSSLLTQSRMFEGVNAMC